MQYCASGLILFENKQGHWHCSTSIVDTSAVITPAPPCCCRCWPASPPRTHSLAAPRSPPAPPRSPTPRRATGSRRSPATRPRSSCWTATSSPPTPTCASRCAAGGRSRCGCSSIVQEQRCSVPPCPGVPGVGGERLLAMGGDVVRALPGGPLLHLRVPLPPLPRHAAVSCHTQRSDQVQRR